MELEDGLEGIDSSEFREMCMMFLNDLEAHEAAKVVLTHHNALLHRLYEDQIKGDEFPQAPGIVWQLTQLADNGLTRQFGVASSFF